METNTNGTTTWANTPAGKQVQARLAEEPTLRAIDHLLSRIDTLDKAVGQLTAVMQQGPGMVAMVSDITDETYRKAHAQGIDIEQRLGNALHIAEKLTAPAMVEKIDQLVQLSEQVPGLLAMAADMYDEGMRKAMDQGFNPQVLIEVAGTANTALTKAKEEAPAKVGGIFGLLRTLRDPDRQRGLGFLMNFLKHFGRNI
ncbi:MAG: DUF1641 domain-containing protein [Bacteroidota bacterium]